MNILGLDLSLTETGVACKVCDASNICAPKKVVGPERLAAHRSAVRLHASHVVGSGVPMSTVAVIEGYGYLKGNAMAIPEVHGVVKVALWEARVPFVIVSPSGLKKWATNNGNSNKAAMISAAIRRYGFQGDNENEADAWLLMRFGMQAYGLYAEPLQYQEEQLAKVEWPGREKVPA